MLRDSQIEHNHNVGVGIFSSDATIETTVVRDIQESESDEGLFADGITVIGDELEANVSITDVQIASNARVGILFVGGAGKISNARVSGNRFGLVLQGSPKPALEEGNTFDSNTEQNKIVGGDLPVPNEAPPLP
jgi:nitrous oxidase accessory protein NosD